MEQNNQPLPPVFNPQQQQQPAAPQYQPRVTARPMMGFIEAVKTCLRKYFTFTGRARRSEYWWFVLFLILAVTVGTSLLAMLVQWLCQAMDVDSFWPVMIVSGLFSIVFVIPVYAAMVRRLHDTGRSGWWVGVNLLCSLVYSGCYTMIMAPVVDKMSSIDDPFALASLMTAAMQQSPTAASLMSLCGMVSFILGIVILIFTLLDSKWGENKYGPSPKYQ